MLLHKLGYFYLDEGRSLFTKISKIINKSRYSNINKNSSIVIEDIFKKASLVFSSLPPFSLSSGKTHIELVRSYLILKRKTSTISVYIYTIEEQGLKLVEGSPFSKYSEAHKALGLPSTSNICHRYLETEKAYKKKYYFSTKPLLNI